MGLPHWRPSPGSSLALRPERRPAILDMPPRQLLGTSGLPAHHLLLHCPRSRRHGIPAGGCKGGRQRQPWLCFTSCHQREKLQQTTVPGAGFPGVPRMEERGVWVAHAIPHPVTAGDRRQQSPSPRGRKGNGEAASHSSGARVVCVTVMAMSSPRWWPLAPLSRGRVLGLRMLRAGLWGKAKCCAVAEGTSFNVCSVLQ